MLDRYSEWLMAQRTNGWEVIDVHGPMNGYLESRRKVEPEFTLAGDGVHLNDEGHWLVSRAVLAYYGVPSEISEAADLDELLSAIPNGTKALETIRKRQRILADAWLTHIGHQRPGMARGLPLAEAEAQADKLEEEINRLLESEIRAAPRPPPQGYYRFPAIRGEMIESWRMLRDYFYDRELPGVDWRGVLAKYLPLVDRVADRGDLSDLISDGNSPGGNAWRSWGEAKLVTGATDMACLSGPRY